jgi:hypothetical protein
MQPTVDLRHDPSRALRAVVRVGSEPAGLVLADDGQIALVGNSNRGLVAGTGGHAPQTVSVIDTVAALAHRPALPGTVPAGLFPRDLSIDPANAAVPCRDAGAHGRALTAVASSEHDDGAPSRFAPRR